MKILSWNLYQRPWLIADWLDTPRLPARRARFLGILETVTSSVPDLALLQEAFHEPTRRALARRFPHSFFRLSTRWLAVHSGLMILSREPILSRSGVVFRHGRGVDAWVNKGVMQAQVGGTHVFNLHLQSGPYPHIRSAQIAELVQFLRGFAGPSILAGDFNLHPGEDRLLDPVFQLGFRDSWLECHPGDPRLRFDRILFRDLGVRCIDETTNRWSDHHAVAAEFDARSNGSLV